jgi:hypothetical protein
MAREHWPVAPQVVHEIAPPLLFVGLFGGADACHYPAV